MGLFSAGKIIKTFADCVTESFD